MRPAGSAGLIEFRLGALLRCRAVTSRWWTRLLLAAPAIVVLVACAFTPASELHSNQGDVGLYLEKARAFAAGQIPYRDFPFEYPPLALVPMVVPYLVWPFRPVSLEDYRWLFVGFEAVLMLVLAVVLARVVRLGALGSLAGTDADAGAGGRTDDDGPVRSMAFRLIVVTAGAALAIAFRFDLFPAVLVTVALWAALAGRPAAAGVTVGLGVLAKLYPLALVPALAIPSLVRLDLPRLVRYGLAAGLTILVVLAAVVILAGQATFAFLRYQAERGLEIESIGGGLAVLVGLLTGRPPGESYGFSDVEVTGPFAAAWLAALPVATALGFGLLAWLGWRRIRLGPIAPATVVTFAGASVLMLLATSKVFSIQYVVWIVPFAALLTGRRFWLAALMMALTMPIHPMLFGDLVRQETLPILGLNLRNALLVGLLGWMLRDLARRDPVASKPGSTDEARLTTR